MNIKDSVSTLMSKDLVIVNPNDEMRVAKEKFEELGIHHLLVEHNRELQGVLSYTDFRFFENNYRSEGDRLIANTRLGAYKIKEVMTPADQLTILSNDASIEEVIKIFLENRFHCIPILKDKQLVGIVTPHDILESLLKG